MFTFYQSMIADLLQYIFYNTKNKRAKVNKKHIPGRTRKNYFKFLHSYTSPRKFFFQKLASYYKLIDLEFLTS